MMVRHISRVLMVGVVLALSACWNGEKTGPEDIHWDRDACELCIMLISDPRFAAEVRGGPKKKLYKFDDVGCATNWLNTQDWAGDPATEIWVADASSTRENVIWLDARTARYLKGEISPMNYGYTAVAPSPDHATPVGIDFVQMTTNILADAPNHICKVPERNE